MDEFAKDGLSVDELALDEFDVLETHDMVVLVFCMLVSLSFSLFDSFANTDVLFFMEMF